MLWPLVAVLPSFCLLSFTKASPVQNHAEYDVYRGNSTETLRTRAPAVEASDLFLIEDGPGTCAHKTETINFWLQEAVELHNAIERAYQMVSQKDMPSGVLFMIWFGVNVVELANDNEAQELWAVIGDHIGRVSQFLSGGGLQNPQASGKPRLFCSADAGEYQPWNQPIKDVNGNPVLDEKSNTESYVKLEQVFDFRSKPECNPFWMRAFNGYDIDCSGTQSLCPSREEHVQNTLRLGKTARKAVDFAANDKIADFELGISNRHILFCPEAFDPAKSHNYESLAKATSADNYPEANSRDIKYSLDRYLTVSSTLYHELYHLTDDSNTEDKAYSMANIINAHQFGHESGMEYAGNPESYAFLAMAAYLQQNPPDGKEPAVYLGGHPKSIEKIRSGG